MTVSLLLLQYVPNYSKQTYFSQLVLLISDWMLMSAISLGIHGKVICISGQVGSLMSACNHITCHHNYYSTARLRKLAAVIQKLMLFVETSMHAPASL